MCYRVIGERGERANLESSVMDKGWYNTNNE